MFMNGLKQALACVCDSRSQLELHKLHFEFVSSAWLVNSGWSLGGQYYTCIKKASADWMAMLLYNVP